MSVLQQFYDSISKDFDRAKKYYLDERKKVLDKDPVNKVAKAAIKHFVYNPQNKPGQQVFPQSMMAKSNASTLGEDTEDYLNKKITKEEYIKKMVNDPMSMDAAMGVSFPLSGNAGKNIGKQATNMVDDFSRGVVDEAPQIVDRFGNVIKSVPKFATPNANPETGASIVEEAVPKVKSAVRTVKSAVSKMPQAPKEAIERYLSIFEIPRPVVEKMSKKPQQIVNTLINDGVTGIQNLDQLKTVAQEVTGESGAFPQINRIILGDIQKPIDYGLASKSIERSINKSLEGSPKGLINTVENQVRRAFPVFDTPSQIGDKKASASELFDTLQELGRLSDTYSRKSTDTYGNLLNPEVERAADAIKEVRNTVADLLDGAISPEQYQAYKTDPRVLEQLNRLPPKLAQRWVNEANQFRDGRSIQSDYVGLMNMIDHTENARLSAFSKLGDKIQGTKPSDVAQKAVSGVFHPVQTLEAGAKGIAGKIASVLDKKPESIMAENTSGTVKDASAGLVSKVLKTGAVAGLGAGATALYLKNKEKPEEQSVTGLTKEEKDIGTGKDRYNLDSPYQSGLAVSNKDYADQKAALQKSISEVSATGNLYQKNILQGQLDQLETKRAAQAPVIQKWVDTGAITRLANDAAKLVEQAPPNPSQFAPWIEKIRSGVDPKYSQLTAALNYFHIKTGADFSQIKTKEALLSALDQLVANSQNEYKSVLEQYSGQAIQDSNLPIIQSEQGQQSSVAPSIPSSNIPLPPGPQVMPQQQSINFLTPNSGDLPPIPAP